MRATLGETLTVAARQNEWELRPSSSHLFTQIDAVHPGHYDIAEHEVKAIRVLLDKAERALGVDREHRSIAEVAKELSRKFAHVAVVLNDENTAFSAAR